MWKKSEHDEIVPETDNGAPVRTNSFAKQPKKTSEEGATIGPSIHIRGDLIGEEDIIVQGTPVAKIDEVMAIKGNNIPALREALLSQNDRVLRREANEDVANREVTIMGDKEIPYRLLKKVMATCTKSDYGQISLAVLQKSSDKLDNIQAAR